MESQKCGGVGLFSEDLHRTVFCVGDMPCMKESLSILNEIMWKEDGYIPSRLVFLAWWAEGSPRWALSRGELRPLCD